MSLKTAIKVLVAEGASGPNRAADCGRLLPSARGERQDGHDGRARSLNNNSNRLPACNLRSETRKVLEVEGATLFAVVFGSINLRMVSSAHKRKRQ